MTSRTAERFWTRYRELPQDVRRAARKAYRLFASNPMHPSLQFERLVRDPRAWSVRVTRGYRAVGWRSGDEITWFWIGPHDEFDRQFSR